MRKRAPTLTNPVRRGGALLIAVVAIAIVGVVAASVTWQCMAGRRLVERRQNQLQAEWLARAGLELAADRLLADPAGYQGESVELIPGAQVRIEVRADPKEANVFRVTSEARFSGKGGDAVPRSAARTFRRAKQGDQVRLEVVAERP